VLKSIAACLVLVGLGFILEAKSNEREMADALAAARHARDGFCKAEASRVR